MAQAIEIDVSDPKDWPDEAGWWAIKQSTYGTEIWEDGLYYCNGFHNLSYGQLWYTREQFDFVYGRAAFFGPIVLKAKEEK